MLLTFNKCANIRLWQLNLSLLWSIALLLIPHSASALDEGDSCIVKSSNGMCIRASECLEKIRGMFSSDDLANCGYGIYEELVCCPTELASDDGNGGTVTRLPTPTTVAVIPSTTSSPITTTPIITTPTTSTTTTTSTSTTTTTTPTTSTTTTSPTTVTDFWLHLLETTTVKPLKVRGKELATNSSYYDLSLLLSSKQSSKIQSAKSETHFQSQSSQVGLSNQERPTQIFPQQELKQVEPQRPLLQPQQQIQSLPQVQLTPQLQPQQIQRQLRPQQHPLVVQQQSNNNQLLQQNPGSSLSNEITGAGDQSPQQQLLTSVFKGLDANDVPSQQPQQHVGPSLINSGGRQQDLQQPGSAINFGGIGSPASSGTTILHQVKQPPPQQQQKQTGLPLNLGGVSGNTQFVPLQTPGNFFPQQQSVGNVPKGAQTPLGLANVGGITSSGWPMQQQQQAFRPNQQLGRRNPNNRNNGRNMQGFNQNAMGTVAWPDENNFDRRVPKNNQGFGPIFPGRGPPQFVQPNQPNEPLRHRGTSGRLRNSGQWFNQNFNMPNNWRSQRRRVPPGWSNNFPNDANFKPDPFQGTINQNWNNQLQLLQPVFDAGQASNTNSDWNYFDGANTIEPTTSDNSGTIFENGIPIAVAGPVVDGTGAQTPLNNNDIMQIEPIQNTNTDLESVASTNFSPDVFNQPNIIGLPLAENNAINFSLQPEQFEQPSPVSTPVALPIQIDPLAPVQFQPQPESTIGNNWNDVTVGHDQNRPVPISTIPDERESTTPSTTTSMTPIRLNERPAVRACRVIEERLSGELTEHILGGTPVELGEYPHMAAIGYNIIGGGAYDFNCGGTLIDKKFVLTAAHCVSRSDITPSIVRMGVTSLTDAEQLKNVVDMPISRVHIHPSYRSSSKYNDIALLELERDVEFTENVAPACLYTNLTDPSDKYKYYVTGWGVIETRTRRKSDILLKARLNIVPVENCNVTYQETGSINRQLSRGIINTQMCAGDSNYTRDACQGDSGGPLNMVLDESLQQYRIVGIISTGFGCATATPGLYTRVSAYLDYIESIVWP